MTPASPRRRQRALATAALGSAAAIVLAGCQWSSTIQTDRAYEPADGTSARIGEVQLSNVLIVAAKKGGPGTLIGRGVNYAQQPVELTFAIGGEAPTKVSIPAGGALQLSDLAAGPKRLLPVVPVSPGDLVDLHITSAGGGDRDLRVPVLAPYPPYEKLAPTNPSPTAGEATPAGPSASPSASPTTTG